EEVIAQHLIVACKRYCPSMRGAEGDKAAELERLIDTQVMVRDSACSESALAMGDDKALVEIVAGRWPGIQYEFTIEYYRRLVKRGLHIGIVDKLWIDPPWLESRYNAYQQRVATGRSGLGPCGCIAVHAVHPVHHAVFGRVEHGAHRGR